MLENIAIIKEVHEALPTFMAQQEAREKLNVLGIEHVASQRLTQCSSLEIFYVMFVRSLMHNKPRIIIVTPFFLIKKLADIQEVLEKITKCNTTKTLVILDNISNQSYYEGKACHIIK